jgi:hypothetical protein
MFVSTVVQHGLRLKETMETLVVLSKVVLDNTLAKYNKRADFSTRLRLLRLTK